VSQKTLGRGRVKIKLRFAKGLWHHGFSMVLVRRLPWIKTTDIGEKPQPQHLVFVPVIFID